MVDNPLLFDDPARLPLNDSVGVLLLTEHRQYLLQKRSSRSGIYFPGFWGLFGGGVRPHETPEDAAKRELLEELGMPIEPEARLMSLDFDLLPLGLSRTTRTFFIATISTSDLGRMILSEGDEMRAFTAPDAFSQLPLVPFDAYAIWLNESQHRLNPTRRSDVGDVSGKTQ